MSIYELIRELIQEKRLTPHQAADEILCRRDHRELVHVLIVREAVHHVRHETRRVERKVARDGVTAPVALRRLNEQYFQLSDGRQIAWLDATVDEHAEKAADLRKLEASVGETAELHEKAIAAIEEAGATCLRDLGEAA